ncbi:MAG: translation initiation factor IF-2 [Candidatus Omnitrophica bacterium]|nr:translation initiation factor IF-2 [Candidatus Omnitrophota bacterium]MDD5770789.1 translation initiation factor IF-2 [Candidatus Omnitrophota bacterium]
MPKAKKEKTTKKTAKPAAQKRVSVHQVEPHAAQKRVSVHQAVSSRTGAKTKKAVPKIHTLKSKAAVKPPRAGSKSKKEEPVQAIKPAGKHEIKPDAKIEVKPAQTHKAAVKHETKAQVHHAAKPQVKTAHEPEAKAQPLAHEIKTEPSVETKAAATPGRVIEIEIPITLKDLAVKLQEKSSILIKHFMGMGMMVGINQPLSEEAVNKLCAKYNCVVKKALTAEDAALQEHKEHDRPENLKKRSPVVTFMGHVDHGKTSLLDAIRKTKVAEGEHGGITQHIGAYRVSLPEGEITFLDTPGHEAFTAMRARGASLTDIVVLVVAADDGIMPQTQEAIDHARAAGVAIIVAVNKIDKPQANIDMVKKQLSQAGLTAEDWGGKTITVPVSAKTGEGIDNLLEMILLQAEIMELKANPNRLANGVVVEARMAKGRGPVATLLVQNGTLHLNQNIIVGNLYGKIRAMLNDRGQSVTAAGCACPVEVLGISGIPQAGEQFFVIEDEKQAKELVEARLEKERQQQIKSVKRVSLEDLHAQIAEGKIKELKLIIKSDVQGSLEAIKDTLDKLNVSEIKIEVIHAGVGNINNSDVMLAVASDALIVGFNVNADDLAKELVAKEGIEVKLYNIIYELANDIKAAVEGMLDPKLKKIFLGRAEVKKMFKLSRSGLIAGCLVAKGKINRNSMVTVVRNGQDVFEGKLSSLKRFKDDVREVTEGFECGIAVSGFDQLMEGDILEVYDIEKIVRRL